MSNYTSIVSPLPGIVYLQPSPEEAVYVKPGDQIKIADVIAIIEIMKTFYEITAEQDGVFEAYMVKNGDTVDDGDTIATLKVDNSVI